MDGSNSRTCWMRCKGHAQLVARELDATTRPTTAEEKEKGGGGEGRP